MTNSFCRVPSYGTPKKADGQGRGTVPPHWEYGSRPVRHAEHSKIRPLFPLLLFLRMKVIACAQSVHHWLEKAPALSRKSGERHSIQLVCEWVVSKPRGGLSAQQGEKQAIFVLVRQGISGTTLRL